MHRRRRGERGEGRINCIFFWNYDLLESHKQQLCSAICIWDHMNYFIYYYFCRDKTNKVKIFFDVLILSDFSTLAIANWTSHFSRWTSSYRRSRGRSWTSLRSWAKVSSERSTFAGSVRTLPDFRPISALTWSQLSHSGRTVIRLQGKKS